MTKSKLIRVLRKLSPDQIRDLGKYIRTEYTTGKSEVEKLYVLVASYYPHFAGQDVDAEALARKLKIEHRSLIKLASKLVAVVESFIAAQWVASRPVLQQVALLQFYQQNMMSRDFEMHYRALQKELDQADMRFNEKWYWYYHIEFINLCHGNLLNRGTGHFNFDLVNDSLNKFVLINKLYWAVWTANTKLSHEIGWEDKLPPDPQAIERSGLLQEPKIRFWHELLQTFEHRSEQSFAYVKDQIMRDDLMLHHEDRHEAFVVLESAVRFIYPQPAAYFQNLFDLYRMEEQKGNMLSNNTIFGEKYRNVVLVALATGRKEEALIFAQKYAPHLPPESAEASGVHESAMAMILFDMGRYDELLPYLNRMSIKNVAAKLDERRIRMKVYYEKQEWEPLLSLINSFRKFLSTYKEDLAEYVLTIHRNFINYVNEMMHIPRGDDEQIDDLLQRIAAEPAVTERAWLVRACEQRR